MPYSQSTRSLANSIPFAMARASKWSGAQADVIAVAMVAMISPTPSLITTLMLALSTLNIPSTLTLYSSCVGSFYLGCFLLCMVAVMFVGTIDF